MREGCYGQTFCSGVVKVTVTAPTVIPTQMPSSIRPSMISSLKPSAMPTQLPLLKPSRNPSVIPTQPNKVEINFNCPPNYTPLAYRKNSFGCYVLINIPLNQSAAKKYCNAKNNGWLATLDDELKSVYVPADLQIFSQTFFGLFKQSPCILGSCDNFSFSWDNFLLPASIKFNHLYFLSDQPKVSLSSYSFSQSN